MDYKIVEMKTDTISYDAYEHKKKELITSFQNEVNKYLNNGYILAGGVSISHIAPGSFHFAQALIKET